MSKPSQLAISRPCWPTILEGILKGPAEIRPLFEAMIKEFSSPDANSTIQERHASGPVAYMIWSAETPQNSYRFATDTIYVVDGRILYQTFAADIVPM